MLSNYAVLKEQIPKQLPLRHVTINCSEKQLRLLNLASDTLTNEQASMETICAFSENPN